MTTIIHNPAFIWDDGHPVVAQQVMRINDTLNREVVGYDREDLPGHNTLPRFEDYVMHEQQDDEEWCKRCDERTSDVRLQAYRWHQETTGCELPFRGWQKYNGTPGEPVIPHITTTFY